MKLRYRCKKCGEVFMARVDREFKKCPRCNSIECEVFTVPEEDVREVEERCR